MSKLGAKVKEAAGYVEEETGEAFKDNKMANKGRDLRNEGRIEDGKLPKITPPGTTHIDNEDDGDRDDAI